MYSNFQFLKTSKIWMKFIQFIPDHQPVCEMGINPKIMVPQNGWWKNKGKPYEQMDDLGVKISTPIFGKRHPNGKKITTGSFPRSRWFHCIHHCQDSPSEPDLEVGKIPTLWGEPVQVIQVATGGLWTLFRFFVSQMEGFKKNPPFVESKKTSCLDSHFWKMWSASFVGDGFHKALRSGDQLVPGDRRKQPVLETRGC